MASQINTPAQPRKTGTKLLLMNSELDNSFQNQSPIRLFKDNDQTNNQNSSLPHQSKGKLTLDLPLKNQQLTRSELENNVDQLLMQLSQSRINFLTKIDPISYYLLFISLITYFWNHFHYFLLNITEFAISFLPQLVYELLNQLRINRIESSNRGREILIQKDDQFIPSEVENIRIGTIYKLKPSESCPIQSYLLGCVSSFELEAKLEINSQIQLYDILIEDVQSLSGQLLIFDNQNAEFKTEEMTYLVGKENIISEGAIHKGDSDLLCVSLANHQSTRLLRKSDFHSKLVVIQWTLIVVSITVAILSTLISVSLNKNMNYFVLFDYLLMYSSIIPSSLRLLIILLTILTKYKITHCDQIDSQITGKLPEVLNDDILFISPTYFNVPGNCLFDSNYEIIEATNKNKEMEAQHFEQENFESSLLTLSQKQKSKIDVCIQEYCLKQNVIAYTQNSTRTIQYQDDNVVQFNILDQIQEDDNTLTTFFIDGKYLLYLRIVDNDKISIYKQIIQEKKYQELIMTNQMPEVNQLAEIEYKFKERKQPCIAQICDLVNMGYKLWIVGYSDENPAVEMLLKDFPQCSVKAPKEREVLVVDEVESIAKNGEYLTNLKVPCVVLFQTQDQFDEVKKVQKSSSMDVKVVRNTWIELNQQMVLPEFSSIPIIYFNHLRLFNARVDKLINFHVVRCFSLCVSELIYQFYTNFTPMHFYGQELQFLSEIVCNSFFSLVFYSMWIDIPAQYSRNFYHLKSSSSFLKHAIIGTYLGIALTLIPLYSLDGPNDSQGLVSGYSTVVIWSFILHLGILHLNTLLDRFIILTPQILTILLSMGFNVLILYIYTQLTDELFLWKSMGSLAMLKIMIECLFVPLGVMAPLLQYYYSQNLFTHAKNTKPLRKLVQWVLYDQVQDGRRLHADRGPRREELHPEGGGEVQEERLMFYLE